MSERNNDAQIDHLRATMVASRRAAAYADFSARSAKWAAVASLALFLAVAVGPVIRWWIPAGLVLLFAAAVTLLAAVVGVIRTVRAKRAWERSSGGAR